MTVAGDTLIESTPFDVQIALWGYAVTGEVLEWSTLTAEDRTGSRANLWDRNAADIEGEYLDCGEGFQPVPRRFALPWVTTALMLQETARIPF